MNNSLKSKLGSNLDPIDTNPNFSNDQPTTRNTRSQSLFAANYSQRPKVDAEIEEAKQKILGQVNSHFISDFYYGRHISGDSLFLILPLKLCQIVVNHDLKKDL